MCEGIVGSTVCFGLSGSRNTLWCWLLFLSQVVGVKGMLLTACSEVFE